MIVGREVPADRVACFTRGLRIVCTAGAPPPTPSYLLESCESPIEKAFISALYTQTHHLLPLGKIVFLFGSWQHQIEGEPCALGDTWAPIIVAPQAQTGGYRVDFLIWCRNADGQMTRATVIELDGHDFHDRTKQQARRDRQRDRYFTYRGWRVVRFTGSEIWENQDAVAREAILLAFDR